MTERRGQYRFGAFVLDLDAGFLRRDGQEVALRPKAFDVLAHLVLKHGRLVAKDELAKAVWPDAAVTDNSLAQCLFEIRRALDDPSQVVIRTVARRGYVFDAPVTVVGDASHHVSVHTSSAVTVVAAERLSSRMTWSVWAAVFIAGGGIAGVYMLGLFPSAVRTQTAVKLADSGRAATAIARDGSTETAIRSVAVMPFADLVGDGDREYAATGLSETLATELASRGLSRVAATAAASHYEARHLSPAQIARALHVDALIVGSIVRDGARFAVNVRLVDGRTEHDVWGARFERATTLELTESEDIILALARQLGLRSSPLPVHHRQRVNPVAREEYLRGRFRWNQRNAGARAAAVEHFTRAVQLQPEYALAWVGLADAYALGTAAISAALMPWPGDQTAAGMMAAERALAIDPLLGEAHAAVGRLRMVQYRWEDAERAFAEAVRLSPSYAPARQWYGTLLARMQKCEAALEQVRVGAEIDPVTPIINEAVGSVHWMCGEPEKAIHAYRRVLDLHPDFAPTHMRLGLAQIMAGDASAAVASLRQAVHLDAHCLVRARLAWALMAAGDREGRTLAQSLVSEVRTRRVHHVCAAVVQSQSGRHEEAMNSLELAYQNQEDLSTLLVDPAWTPLRTTRRYQDLVRKVGLAP